MFGLFRRSPLRLKARVARQKTVRRVMIEALESRSLLATFTVINTLDTGAGSFRDAITQANATVGADTIAFAIPGAGIKTIAPLSALPAITDSVTIDGTTQGASTTPLIQIDGTGAGTAASGIRLTGGSSTLRGLAINNFRLSGVLITSNGNRIEGSFIGLNPNGSTAAPNLLDGVVVSGSFNIIGGTATSAANFISGNGRNGVSINGTTATNNSIIRNTIGLSSNRSSKVPNVNAGVRIGSGAKLNTVGSLVAAEQNFISGNTAFGVLIEGTGTDSNVVQGNAIGNGTAAASGLGNGVGVTIRGGAKSNSIGTPVTNGGNTISGNDTWGVQLRGVGTSQNQVSANNIGGTNGSTPRLANGEDGVLIDTGATNNTIGGTTAAHANTISGNTKSGINISGAGTNANNVLFNTIGLNSTGFTTVSNSVAGITIRAGAANNQIGSPGAGNTISGNLIAGVRIQGGTNNSIRSNVIGLNLTRTLAVPNSLDGIVVEQGSTNNSIGGTSPLDANIISGNTRAGVRISGAGTTGNSVRLNKIGTAADTTVAIGNLIGVWITAGASNNTVGAANAGNTISGNLMIGVSLSGIGTDNNTVRSNLIGVSDSAAAAQPNLDGVNISAGAKTNTIGGTTTPDRNIISGNSRDGIGLTGASTSGNRILGNHIGFSEFGSTVRNGRYGINVQQGAKNTIIGLAAAQPSNFISGNGIAGIQVSDAGSSATIVNNVVGLLPTGLTSGVVHQGIRVVNDASAIIGGTNANEGNVVSGNIEGLFISSITGTTILGNLIGLNAAGTLARGNQYGVRVVGGQNITIGSAGSGRNVVAGNNFYGILIFGGNNITIKGNLIGTDRTGLIGISNSRGVDIGNVTNVQVGGPTSAEGNYISGNSMYGLGLSNRSDVVLPDPNVRVENNTIGIGIDGVTAVPNGDGVSYASNRPSTLVGNVISGNARNGISGIMFTQSIFRNKIGVLGDGVTPAGNGQRGIFVTDNSSLNRIGGETDSDANIIGYNGNDGILIGSDPALGFSALAGPGNTLLRNFFFSNVGQSIDLGANSGVSINDVDDIDGGANNLQNYPVMTVATVVGDSLVLRGSLDSRLGGFRIDFYTGPAPGQAQKYVGYVIDEISSNLDLQIAVILEATVEVGDYVMAMATNLETGDSSELSVDIQVV